MALVGNLKELPFTDLIQLCCAFRGTTHIKLDFGDNSGSVFLKNFEIIDAEIGNLKGEQAFYEILLQKDGKFWTETDPKFSPERTINRSWQHLLFDRMQPVNKTQSKATDLTLPEPLYLKDEVEDADEVMIIKPSHKSTLKNETPVADEILVLDIFDNPTDSGSNRQIIDEIENQAEDHSLLEDNQEFELAVQNSSDEHDALLQRLLSSGVVKGGVVIDEDGSTICEISENDPNIKQLASLVKGIENIVMSTFFLGDLNGAVLEIQQTSLLVKNFQNLSLVFSRPERVPIVRAFDGVQKAFEGALGLPK
jgi:hypothetical protein